MNVQSARRVLVAGIGNVFLADDGFGVEVVGMVDAGALPPSADVADYGVAGVHLAYDVLDGHYDTLIIVDAAPVGEPPGTLAVLRCGTGEQPAGLAEPAAVNGHAMTPMAVLDVLSTLGCPPLEVLVIGCQPAVLEERIGLSEHVRRALPEAARLATSLAWDAASSGTPNADVGMERAGA